ncbi:CBS domain-containing protein [Halanaerobacter jeridensis]|uniref:tRNA nucleotidyltransferase (CCA-adding enzyme) n=1 Tax=Halanaerobacter jeridensis TaxID=706427 RepID=A0A938XU55_9FIRM|nr:CBS domain-containing protein [Halanaerobacter jeridensis]MBM7555300.1 tRNA nucleotidyltransferase (CCA-adding enzyme) [Halanaerobacter jeridensis]
MEIIISHQRTDFDGLAAMVAAKKLHPEAVMVFSGKTTNNVKRYMSLYKDRITVKKPSDIDYKQINRIIMVDTRVAARIGPFSDLVEENDVDVLIYDHHLGRNNPIQNAEEIIEPVGATSTMLVDKIYSQGIDMTSFEATLFALGIYEDTGCLIYESTTSEDARAVGYLLDQGANLEIVEEYIEYSLNRKQQELFNKLLDSIHQISIKGYEIDIFQAEMEEYIPDVSLLAHKLNELHDADALFVLAKYNQKLLIVGRSNDDSINVGETLKYFGGGGHNRAASATIKTSDEWELIEWQEKVLQVVKEKINPAILVEDIMSTPVETITPDTTMREADQMMLRHGHSGLVVEKDNEIVGIISRRDIDKVRNYDLLHAPVKGYMRREVVTIEPNASLKEVQEAIVEHDIGRLPVVTAEGELIGIVTRSDLLKLFYGTDDYLKNRQNLYGRSLVQVQEKRYDISDKLELIDEQLLALLKKAGRMADSLDFDLYIVGGFPRDLVLGQVNHDLDLVVEGDGIEFARELSKELGGHLDIYHEFGTAVVSLEDLKLDIATTRVEYYPQVASLPEVEHGSIQQDLFRRDFTINALAIQLNQASFGQLVDYFSGKKDLEKGLIRLLHNFSLYDDPTRIFRGFRFASRYDYNFEENTEDLFKHAIELDVIEKLSSDRLFNKLELGLKDRNPVRFISLLDEYNILSYFSPGIEWNHETEILENNVTKVLDWLHDLEIVTSFEEWVLYLIVLVHGLNETEIKDFANKFNINKNLFDRLMTSLKADKYIRILHDAEDNSAIYYLLQGLAIEDMLFLLIKDFSLEEEIKLYLEKLQWTDIEVSGEEIIALGYSPGPIFREVLDEVRKAKLNGEVETYEEEKEYLEQLLAERESE